MTNAHDHGVHASSAWTLQALFTVALLGITAGVQMSDMGLQAISLSAIQNSFGVGDATLGALQGLAGVLVGSALAVPLARFADRFSRKRVLLCLILASTAMMVLSALAPNFPLFFIGRSAAGITEFAMVPLVYSMIPDLAPERHRVAANLSFAALMAAGASGGFYFGGAILATAADLFPWAMAPWRKAFLLLSMAGVPLLLLGMLTADPPRRLGPAGHTAPASLRLFLRQRWQAIGLFVGVAGCLMIAVQALNQLIALALERRFDALPGDIGQALGVIVLITTVGCLPVAGLLDRMLGRRFGRAVRPLIMGTCALAAAPVVLLLVSTRTLDHAFLVVGLFLFVTCVANALVPTMLQDLAPATLRARCFAVWSFVVSVFSAAGPLLAGTLSDWMFERHMLNAITAVAVPALAVSAFCAMRSFARTRRERAMLAGQPA
ncbi:MFS transporter [Thauera linaloolentis]|uniref:Major facilitator transporter n=1 Tax=Thauera linaloolentis (strain DSM 12138 / JCM 21573 / CCUG 41526 / CIP 105981 / IAM 15112 / NBRC 102519 / 47Lol) TaxID=1123367 RepID=N6Z0I4_THAL4|nr:MFS transporter [Thauera linaloolentis]ENO88137.1 major facilitator transporter [Thauera linaloolentis 47Lol = DSM 12138]MCM8565829.1 MFS transporter [Thauera linaloolentis]